MNISTENLLIEPKKQVWESLLESFKEIPDNATKIIADWDSINAEDQEMAILDIEWIIDVIQFHCKNKATPEQRQKMSEGILPVLNFMNSENYRKHRMFSENMSNALELEKTIKELSNK